MPQVGGASPGPNKAPEVAKVSRWLYPYPTPGVIAAPRGRPGAGEARGAGHPGTGPAKVKPERDLTPLRARPTLRLTKVPRCLQTFLSGRPLAAMGRMIRRRQWITVTVVTVINQDLH